MEEFQNRIIQYLSIVDSSLPPLCSVKKMNRNVMLSREEPCFGPAKWMDNPKFKGLQKVIVTQPFSVP